jgi:hypothetical protein
MLVAGKGLGEDVTNGAAARPVGAAREGRPSKGGESERREREKMSLRPSLRGRGCQRAEIE